MTEKNIYSNKIFEDIKHYNEFDIEFWYARELQEVLKYTKWSNFKNVIKKAKDAYSDNKNSIEDHFTDVGKKVTIGSGAVREIQDIMLSRYACYLIMQNGDAKKELVAIGQEYFMSSAKKKIEYDFQPSNVLIYELETGKIKIEVKFEDETVWLNQNQMAQLFQVTKQNVSLHINNIFLEEELDKKAVVKEFLTTASDGKNYNVIYYNLDVVISVGYRVKSKIGTKFRIWATNLIKEYIRKGFAMDDERLKNQSYGKDYFDELLSRIQDIRTSEKRFYQKIMDIYSLSIDYNPKVELSQEFFATVQNKLHWAIVHKTAAEIIYDRADGQKPNMGLTVWKNDRIRKSDIRVAKNYMETEEISALKDLVEQYLVFAETQAKRKVPMRMVDWIIKLEGFLTLNDREILKSTGKISHKLAMEKAENEFEKFKINQQENDNKIESDFDKYLKKLEDKIIK